MAYCRWSSENNACDVYAYESEWGFLVHTKDGQCFIEGDLEDLLLRLEELREKGLYIPQWALDKVNAEIEEERNERWMDSY